MISQIEGLEFNFTKEDTKACNVFSFVVTATNAAGESAPSEMISRSLPTIPDISLVQESLKYSIAKTTEGVFLTVKINVLTVTNSSSVENTVFKKFG